MKLIHVSGRTYDLFHDTNNPWPTGFDVHTRFEVDHRYKETGRVHFISGEPLNSGIVRKIQRGLEFGVKVKEI